MCWKLSSGLPDTSFQELLKFLSLLLPGKADSILCSLYKFEKFIAEITVICDDVIFIHCQRCKKSLKNIASVENDDHTHNEEDMLRNNQFFVYCPIETLFSRFFNIEKNQRNVINFMAKYPEKDDMHDLHDSDRYKKIMSDTLCLPGAEESLIPIKTVQLNLDGIDMATSAAHSGLPLMLTINELPPKSRRNGILTPFFFMQTVACNFDEEMLAPFIEDMNRLYRCGFQWTAPDETLQITQGIPHCQCMDSMMKYKMMNVKSPSGYSSCTLCKIEGCYIYKGKGGSIGFSIQLNQNGSILRFDAAVDASVRKLRLDNANEIILSVRRPQFIERGPRPATKSSWRGHEWEEFFWAFLFLLLANNGKVISKKADLTRDER